MMRKLNNIKALGFMILILFIMSSPCALYPQDEDFHLRRLLDIVRRNPSLPMPVQNIYMKNNVLYCTGTDKAAELNNRAADLLAEEKYSEAADLLEQGLTHSALFFPFRYNLGTAYFFQNKLRRSLLNFQKAQLLVPEYSKTYLQIGFIYERWNLQSEAIEYFRKALKRNSKELDTFVLIGDIFYKRNQIEMAKKYYEASLRIYHRFPNGLLGRAKVFFKQGKYIKTIVQLKSIKPEAEYNKELHYYYAESAFKLRDYKTAYAQYKKLLEFKNDRFYITNSRSLIRHKLEISRRFAER